MEKRRNVFRQLSINKYQKPSVVKRFSKNIEIMTNLYTKKIVFLGLIVLVFFNFIIFTSNDGLYGFGLDKLLSTKNNPSPAAAYNSLFTGSLKNSLRTLISRLKNLSNLKATD